MEISPFLKYSNRNLFPYFSPVEVDIIRFLSIAFKKANNIPQT